MLCVYLVILCAVCVSGDTVYCVYLVILLAVCIHGDTVCCVQRVTRVSECPALVPPNPPTTNTYNLHVNLSTDSRPQLLLRTRNIGSLTVMFDQRLFHCVVCLDHCGSEDDVIFRLEARVVAGNGRDTWIDCQGETVSCGIYF